MVETAAAPERLTTEMSTGAIRDAMVAAAGELARIVRAAEAARDQLAASQWNGLEDVTAACALLTRPMEVLVTVGDKVGVGGAVIRAAYLAAPMVGERDTVVETGASGTPSYGDPAPAWPTGEEAPAWPTADDAMAWPDARDARDAAKDADAGAPGEDDDVWEDDWEPEPTVWRSSLRALDEGPAAAAGVIDPLTDAQALAKAYERGYTVVGSLSGGNHGVTERVILSDGTEAVRKTVAPDVAEGDEPQTEYLAGLVAGALGIDGVGTARVEENVTVSRFIEGQSGAAEREAAGESSYNGSDDLPVTELRRMTDLRNGREIGLLDFIVNNVDRSNSNNFAVAGDAVLPWDHGSCLFKVVSEPEQEGDEEMDSPFSRAHLDAHCDVTSGCASPDVPRSRLVNPFTADELAQHRANLERLAPEFAAQGATDKHEFMMGQLGKIEAAPRSLRQRAARTLTAQN